MDGRFRRLVEASQTLADWCAPHSIAGVVRNLETNPDAIRTKWHFLVVAGVYSDLLISATLLCW